MKIIVRTLIIALGLFIVLASPRVAEAQAGRTHACEWDSTQARVQVDESDPWKKELHLGCEESFNIGSFHDGTGEFARDTNLTVIYPDGNERDLKWWTSNGRRIEVTENGTYELKVDTMYRYGATCEDTAKVIVDCDHRPQPEPQPTHKPVDTSYGKADRCEYQNTQARVQESIKHHWAEEIKIGCFESFNVGSFHDGTGKFADDTKLKVVADIDLPWNEKVELERSFENGDKVFTFFPGFYTLKVTTEGQTGMRCEDTARVEVKCGKWLDFMSGWQRVD